MNKRFTASRVPDSGMEVLFATEERWQAWLDIESALAFTPADLEMIPLEAADAITAACRSAGGREPAGKRRSEAKPLYYFNRHPEGHSQRRSRLGPDPEGYQALSGLERPTELYVDGAYVSAIGLHEAKNQGRELIGPAQPRAKISAGTPIGFA